MREYFDEYNKNYRQESLIEEHQKKQAMKRKVPN